MEKVDNYLWKAEKSTEKNPKQAADNGETPRGTKKLCKQSDMIQQFEKTRESRKSEYFFKGIQAPLLKNVRETKTERSKARWKKGIDELDKV